jgi:voltage-gated potassium channel Kch
VLEDNDPHGWIYRAYNTDGEMPLVDTDYWMRYSTSLYWAFTTLTTVGYGDVSAGTMAEQMFSIATMMIGVTW